MEGQKKVAHHGFTHTHVTHHGDGSATVHHVHHKGPEHDVEHAVPSLDHLHDSMQDHLGTPNPGEAAANASDHGVPAAAAGPAGLPLPAGGAPAAGA